MNETAETPALNKALAEFQASLPRVGKDNRADVPGKDGKKGFSYKYADLADISQVALPLLGKFGLAFTAKPTVLENGAFVLHYKLTHSSGERDEGFYLLPSPDRTGAQQVGSAITYARRYCLCAVTGIHPDGEDDDAARAQSAPYSASQAWEQATPAKPANGQSAGQVSRPAPPPQAPQADGEPDPDAQPYADEAHEARTLAALKEVNTRAREAHKLAAMITNPSTGGSGGLGQYIGWRRPQLEEVETALAALHAAAGASRMDITEMDLHVKKITGKDIESASAAELKQAADALAAVPA